MIFLSHKMLLRNLRLWIIHFNLNGPCMASKTKTSSHKVWRGKLTAQSIQRCVQLQYQPVSSPMKMLLFGSNVILDSITRWSTAPAPAFVLPSPDTGTRTQLKHWHQATQSTGGSQCEASQFNRRRQVWDKSLWKWFGCSQGTRRLSLTLV